MLRESTEGGVRMPYHNVRKNDRFFPQYSRPTKAREWISDILDGAARLLQGVCPIEITVFLFRLGSVAFVLYGVLHYLLGIL